MTQAIKDLIYHRVFGSKDPDTSSERIENDDCVNRALLLTAAERDTLREAYLHGPLFDGMVPNHTACASLIEKGLIAKVIVKGQDDYNACTYKGALVFRCVCAALEVGGIE